MLQSIRAKSYEIKINLADAQLKQSEIETSLLSDPKVEYDYLFGSVAGTGNQKDFAVTQEFDYPTTYSAKRKLNELKVRQVSLVSQLHMHTTLSTAKILLIQKIWINKKRNIGNQRIADAKALVDAFEKKLQFGEATVIDVNRARLHLFRSENDASMLELDARSVDAQLAILNGGAPVIFNDTTYFPFPEISSYAQLDSIVAENDLYLKALDNESGIMQQEIALQKALTLPRFELGYHSQSILGQSFRGVHIGMSIPLFEKKNKVQNAHLNLAKHRYQSNQHVAEHQMENKQLLDSLHTYKNTVVAIGRMKQQLNTEYLIGKALTLGEITVTQYLKEKEEYYTVIDQYLDSEFLYYHTLGRIFRFYNPGIIEDNKLP